SVFAKRQQKHGNSSSQAGESVQQKVSGGHPLLEGKRFPFGRPRGRQTEFDAEMHLHVFFSPEKARNFTAPPPQTRIRRPVPTVRRQVAGNRRLFRTDVY